MLNLSCSYFLLRSLAQWLFFTLARRIGNVGGSSSYDPAESGSDRKRLKHSFQSKTIKVLINYAAKIPMQAIVNGSRGQDSKEFQEAVRVLDIILRQHAVKQ